jgi:hypothetical protein
MVSNVEELAVNATFPMVKSNLFDLDQREQGMSQIGFDNVPAATPAIGTGNKRVHLESANVPS